MFPYRLVLSRRQRLSTQKLHWLVPEPPALDRYNPKGMQMIVDNGFSIVSGLANRADTAAHYGCLENKGETIAVLAHSLKEHLSCSK